VIDAGIVIEVNELAPKKALLPMNDTESGITADVNELAPWKVFEGISVIFSLKLN